MASFTSSNSQLNTTTLAAAEHGPSIENPRVTGQSEARNASAYVGRYCGSIYAIAVIEALAAEDSPLLEKQTDTGTYIYINITICQAQRIPHCPRKNRQTLTVLSLTLSIRYCSLGRTSLLLTMKSDSAPRTTNGIRDGIDEPDFP